jgi:hypothetical protein
MANLDILIESEELTEEIAENLECALGAFRRIEVKEVNENSVVHIKSVCFDACCCLRLLYCY